MDDADVSSWAGRRRARAAGGSVHRADRRSWRRAGAGALLALGAVGTSLVPASPASAASLGQVCVVKAGAAILRGPIPNNSSIYVVYFLPVDTGVRIDSWASGLTYGIHFNGGPPNQFQVFRGWVRQETCRY